MRPELEAVRCCAPVVLPLGACILTQLAEKTQNVRKWSFPNRARRDLDAPLGRHLMRCESEEG